jgi:hypothetical protein
MAYETTAISDTLSGPSAADLSTAIHTLTQATQVLTTTATQMMQVMQTLASGTGVSQLPRAAVATQINTWEDDPFSEAVPTTNPPLATPLAVPVPSNTNALLQTNIVEPQPAPGLFPTGTPNFRYWVAAEALARGINFWAPLLPAGTRWSCPNPMQVTLVTPGQEDLNAFYSRQDGGLFFFQQTVKNRQLFSGESPDVVCHELGHAILDALKPQLFDAASTEVAAFHESFGDMSGILCALQFPTERQKVLTETQGRINVSSRLSRLAEQLGWGIRQLAPTAVERDCLRNAANSFFYRRPSRLPSQAPASQLSSEVHSFSRIFTGAFLDALNGMLQTLGAATEANLLAVSRTMGQLLVDGVHTAPVTSGYYSQVAAAMMQADQARNQGRNRTALSSAFRQHGILALSAAAALSSAPVPQRSAVPEVPVGLAGMAGIGGRVNGSHLLLTYDNQEGDAYRRGPEDAPALPTQSVSTDFGMTLLVHAPAEPERFTVTSAALGGDPAEPPAPEGAARAFIEDLLQLDRIDLRAVYGRVPVELTAPSEGRSRKTHTVQDGPEGPVLKRHHFDCGFHGRA